MTLSHNGFPVPAGFYEDELRIEEPIQLRMDALLADEDAFSEAMDRCEVWPEIFSALGDIARSRWPYQRATSALELKRLVVDALYKEATDAGL